LVQSAIDIKSWQACIPSVREVRPRCCPCCNAPSEEIGARVRLHGHGVRERQLRGPLASTEPPTESTVLARRYRCTDCGAVVIVVPRGVAYRRLFTAPAIVLALCLWAVEQQPARKARDAVSPHRHIGAVAGWGWTSLVRWARDAARGRIVRKTRPVARDGDPRAVARRVVLAVAAFAPPGLRDATLREQVFAGAALAA